MSTKSMKEEVMEEIQRDAAEKPNWDKYSQAGSEMKEFDPEKELASRLAQQVLEQNPNLKNVHSKTSMQAMLEKEAKKQLEQGGYQGPLIATHNDHMKVDGV